MFSEQPLAARSARVETRSPQAQREPQDAQTSVALFSSELPIWYASLIMEKGFPFYKVFGHGTGRYELWLCVDLGDSSLCKLHGEDSFDDYLQAARRAELNNEELARARTPLNEQ